MNSLVLFLFVELFSLFVWIIIVGFKENDDIMMSHLGHQMSHFGKSMSQKHGKYDINVPKHISKIPKENDGKQSNQ